MEKILTIIIPTYNMEKYLNKCLTSLIIDDKELMKKLEVLVVIDGAKDRSSEIAHTYQDKYPDTYVVIDKENGNYGSCINRGLKEATGKYVKVLDADDYFETSNFQKYLNILRTSDEDLVITDFEYVNESYETTGLRTRNLTEGLELKFENILDNFNTELISMHELTYKASIFADISYQQTEGISYTDLEWCFLPMSKVVSVLYSKKVVYKYLIGREGQTVSSEVAKRTISHKIISCIAMLKQFENHPLDQNHRLYMQRRLLWSAGAIFESLLLCDETLHLSELIEFDKKISMISPFIYQKLGELKIDKRVPYKYIECWRKQRNKLYRSAFLTFVCKVQKTLLIIKGLVR